MFIAQFVLQLLHEADELTLLSLSHSAVVVAVTDDALESFETRVVMGGHEVEQLEFTNA